MWYLFIGPSTFDAWNQRSMKSPLHPRGGCASLKNYTFCSQGSIVSCIAKRLCHPCQLTGCYANSWRKRVAFCYIQIDIARTIPPHRRDVLAFFLVEGAQPDAPVWAKRSYLRMVDLAWKVIARKRLFRPWISWLSQQQILWRFSRRQRCYYCRNRL